MFDEVTDVALKDAIHSSLWKGWTPGVCFLEAKQKKWSTLDAGERFIRNARDAWELERRPVVRAHAKSFQSMVIWGQAAGWPNGRVRILLREKKEEAIQTVTLKRKKTMSEDQSPWRRYSSQGSKRLLAQRS